MTSPDDLTLLEDGGRTAIRRRGDTVIRDTGPWTAAVHALLRHLENVSFTGAPWLVGSGLDSDGREVLTFIDGEFTQPAPWTLDGAAALGGLLRSGTRILLALDSSTAGHAGLFPARRDQC